MKIFIPCSFWVIAALSFSVAGWGQSKGSQGDISQSLKHELLQLKLLEPSWVNKEISLKPGEKAWLHQSKNSTLKTYLRLDPQGRPEIAVERNGRLTNCWDPVHDLESYSEKVDEGKVTRDSATNGLQFSIQYINPKDNEGPGSGRMFITLIPVLWSKGIEGFWMEMSWVPAAEGLAVEQFRAYRIKDGKVQSEYWEDEDSLGLDQFDIPDIYFGTNKKDGTNEIVFRKNEEERVGRVLNILKWDTQKKEFRWVGPILKTEEKGTNIEIDLPDGKATK